MKKLIVTAAFALVAACSNQDANTSAQTTAKEISAASTDAAVALSPVADAEIIAVLIRADWCSSCKIIEPKLAVAKADGPISGLAHITLDYTDRDKNAFFANAKDAGVSDAVRSHLGGDDKTGIILLVDRKRGDVVADLRKKLSADEIRRAMIDAGKAAAG